MNYPQLCAQLESELGTADIYDKRYPQLGAASADVAALVIWAHDGVFVVGGVDRGEFKTVREFATETEACEYVLDAMRRNSQVQPETPEERQASRAVTEAFTADLLKEFDIRGD